jgi:MFS transporter, DHA2 family, multidrug resistance protein
MARTTDESPGLLPGQAADPRRWWALGALALSGLVVGLDLTVLNLALPILSTSLHASTSQLQWFVDAYSLVLAALLLPGGLLGDRYGRKKILLISLTLFAIASLACAYSSTSDELIAGRALLGLAAACVFPLSLSVLPVIFSEEERPTAVTVSAVATLLSYPIGPIVGGWLLTHFWWGSVFLINVPVVIVAIIAVVVLLPESRSSKRFRIDVLGIVISGGALTWLTYGAIEAGANGWSSVNTIAAMTGGTAVLLAFVYWERWIGRRRDVQPIVDLSLFRSACFAWGTILVTGVSFVIFGLLFTVPQYFQDVRGASVMGTGLRLLPMLGGLIVGAVVANQLAARIGTKIIVAVGFVLAAGGLALGSATHLDSSENFVLMWTVLFGLGLGFALPMAMDAALGVLSRERSGAGSAVILALRQVGGTIGVAILGAVLSATYHSGLAGAHLPSGVAQTVGQSVAAGAEVARRLGSATLLSVVRMAFVHGMDTLLTTSSVIAIACAVLAVIFLPRDASGDLDHNERSGRPIGD